MHGSLTSILKGKGTALNLLEACETFLFGCFKFIGLMFSVVSCEVFVLMLSS